MLRLVAAFCLVSVLTAQLLGSNVGLGAGPGGVNANAGLRGGYYGQQGGGYYGQQGYGQQGNGYYGQQGYGQQGGGWYPGRGAQTGGYWAGMQQNTIPKPLYSGRGVGTAANVGLGVPTGFATGLAGGLLG